MGITHRVGHTRNMVATGVDRDKGNSARLKLVGTRTPNSGVDILSHLGSR
jgi:hypothetical protein